MSRSSFAYERAPSRNVELTQRLRELAAEQPRAGCRMAWAQLRGEFAPLNLKRVRRIWLAEGLSRRPRLSRRIRGAPKPEAEARWPRHIWCMDFAHDTCASGTRFKCLAVLDEASRECLALHVATRIPGEAVADVLKAAFERYGKPEALRCDNGPEFTSWSLKLFLEDQGVRHLLIQPGSPWQNGYAESFIGTFRAECLDAEVFDNMADAQLKIGLWTKFYNEDRPHSSIGYLQPRAFTEKWNEIALQQRESVV
jgi:putative transposase